MRHISLTPFGRQPLSAGHLAAQRQAEAPAPSCPPPDKWVLLRDLTAARAAFGVTDRNLCVLAALLSFLPGTTLEDTGATLIVFPSNAALAERTHGMAEATLRRHLAALIHAGLIVRHDSPNGKRYARRGAGGAVETAFGFDLRPLLTRGPEISEAAVQARAEATRLRLLRERAVLALRDVGKLVAWGDMEADFAARLVPLQRAVRRRMDFREAAALADAAQALRADVLAAVAMAEPEKMDGNARENERHQQNSKTEIQESEPCEETRRTQSDGPSSNTGAVEPDQARPLPLRLVLKAAPDISAYARHGINNWCDMIATADFVRPMLGISPDAWAEAQRIMGPPIAAIALACILQDAERIRRPGGYLRALSNRAADSRFSPGPMVMALLRREDGRAA